MTAPAGRETARSGRTAPASTRDGGTAMRARSGESPRALTVALAIGSLAVGGVPAVPTSSWRPRRAWYHRRMFPSGKGVRAMSYYEIFPDAGVGAEGTDIPTEGGDTS